MRFRLSAVLILLLVASGCGGQRAIDFNPAPQVQNVPLFDAGAADATPQPKQRGVSQQPLEVVDALPAVPRGQQLRPEYSVGFLGSLPELPDDSGFVPELPRAVSATQQYQANLSAPFDQKDAVAGPGSLVLNSTAGDVSFAVYRFPLQPTENLISLLIEGEMTNTANGANSGIYVGLANYFEEEWQFFPPVEISSSFDFQHNYFTPFVYLSPTRSHYLVVLTYNGDAATISNIQVTAFAPTPSWFPDGFGFALSALGLTESELGFDTVIRDGEGNPFEYGEMSFASPGARDDLLTQLPTFFNAWYADAAGFPPYLEQQNADLGAITELQDLFIEAVSEFPPDKRIEAQNHNPTLAPTDPLANAIADYVDAVGGTSDFPTYQAALATMPEAQQEAIAPIFYAMIQAHTLRQTALDGMGFTDPLLETYFNWAHGAWVDSELFVPAVYDVSGGNFLLRGFDYVPFFTGAALILDSIDDLRAFIDANNPVWADVNLVEDTPAGRIVIGGLGNDNHTVEADGHAFLLDLGGNDTYDCHAGGTASPANGVAVCLDLAGDDVYNRLDDPDSPDRDIDPSDDHTSQQGAGRFGIGILVDFDGSDDMQSVRLSQGSAIFGVGFLANLGSGNDTYAFEALGQGGAYAGIGILYDQGGTDDYDAWQLAQGFGGLMGVGLLVDQGAGGDEYTVRAAFDATKPEYASAGDILPPGSSDASNASFSQGAARGLSFNQYTNQSNGHNVVGAGGYGLLYDQGGNNLFQAGVFAQGFSQFQGLGILHSGDGNSMHMAKAFAHGSALTFSAAALWAEDGNDTYIIGHSTNDAGTLPFNGMAGGFDQSLTWLLERGGNDTYQAKNFMLATGVANSFAYMIDFGGADSLQALEENSENTTLGRGYLSPLIPRGNPREQQPTRGIYSDEAGVDTFHDRYEDMLRGPDGTFFNPPPGNDNGWTRAGYPNDPADPPQWRLGEEGHGRS